MVTIRHLEVHLEHDGQGDEATFVAFFEKYISRWNRRMEEAKQRQKMADAHRSVGDQGESEC